jgi:hypothetical protein
MRKHCHSLLSNVPPRTYHSNSSLLVAVCSSAARSYKSKLQRLRKGSFSSSRIVCSGYQVRTGFTAVNSSRRSSAVARVPQIGRKWFATGAKAMQTFPSFRILGHLPCYPAASLNCLQGEKGGIPVAVPRRGGYTKAILNWWTSMLS